MALVRVTGEVVRDRLSILLPTALVRREDWGDDPVRDAAVREGHLFHALTSRIAIEQAKGMVAERFSVDMDDAFARLRNHSRNNNVSLTSLAESLVAGTTPIDDITAARPPSRSPRHP